LAGLGVAQYPIGTHRSRPQRAWAGRDPVEQPGMKSISFDRRLTGKRLRLPSDQSTREGRIVRWWKSLSIATRLHVLIQGALLVILLSLQAGINVLVEKDVLAQAKARAFVSADGVINGMNMLMETGMISVPDNRALLIRKMGASENVRELRIIRAGQVQDQFGPGLPEEQARDEMDREAMRSATPQFRLLEGNNDHLMRAVVPFLVSTNFRGTNCLNCHHVKVGSVNGAASITVDLSEDFEFLGRIDKIMWSAQGGLQLLLFVVIGVMTRRSPGRCTGCSGPWKPSWRTRSGEVGSRSIRKAARTRSAGSPNRSTAWARSCTKKYRS
jgi:hypothetical protein